MLFFVFLVLIGNVFGIGLQGVLHGGFSINDPSLDFSLGKIELPGRFRAVIWPR